MKSLIGLGIIVGSTVGGWLPSLFHLGIFSIWGILGSLVGAFVGGWVAYNYSD